jgi:molybdopterin synthase sulfur carrier subunit
MLHIIYFAQLKDDINCSDEDIDWQAHMVTVKDLKTLLSTRSPKWQHAFQKNILSAVNQTMAHDEHAIKDGDEIAFFPPVTGG